MISIEDVTDTFNQCLKEREYRLLVGSPEDHIEAIRRIIQRNIESGRFQYVKEHYRDGRLTVAQYARQVIPHYLENHL
ncbi:MAG: hypothetical protein ACE5JP_17720, partial [Candidatus Bipolaricaulia bacterium]